MSFKETEVYEILNPGNTSCGTVNNCSRAKFIRFTDENSYEILDEKMIRQNTCSYCFKTESVGSELKLKNSKSKSIMSKLTTMFKMLVDSDTQTLKKAGFINGDLELTDEGKGALMAISFAANKTALVKAAQETLDEEEKNSK